MIGHFVLGILAAFSPLQEAPRGAVAGQLLSESNGRPLAFAVVELVDGGFEASAAADHLGRYRLAGIPAGRQLLRAKHIGHTSLEVEVWVPENGVLALDFSLEMRPIGLPPVTARSAPAPGAADSVHHPRPTRGVTGVKTIQSTPGLAELGLGDANGGSDGNPNPPDPSDFLYVRGSTANLKRVLLDGAPVTAPFHLGGVIEGFEPHVLGSAQLYLGGAPARYDGGLSYVLDLQSRPGQRDRSTTEMSIDLLSTAARTEGPIGSRVAYMVSGRRLHGSDTAGLLDEPFPYGYADGIARIDAQLGRWGALALMGFVNRESVSIDPSDPRQPRASWGNTAGSLRYRGQLASHQVEATAAFGRYAARLPPAGPNSFDSEADSEEARFALDLTRNNGRLRVQYGLGYEQHHILSEARSSGTTDSVEMVSAQTDGEVAGAYVDLGWEPVSNLRLRGGLRGDLFISDRQPRLAPRLAATWLLTERAALTVAVGRYHQYVRMAAPRDEQADQSDPGLGSLLPFFSVAVAGASHLRVALDQRLGEGVRLGIEGYAKRYWDLPVPEQENAQAAGVDIWVHRNTGRVTGWLGYSLGWAWSTNEPSTTTSFSGTHVLSGGVAAPLGSAGKLDFRVSYGAGLPYAAIPHQSVTPEAAAMDVNSFAHVAEELSMTSSGNEIPYQEPAEPYLRLDAEISRTWTSSWLGVDWDITPYLRVLNALDRRDALFYVGDGSSGIPKALAPLPILPVVGVSWKF